MTQHLASLDYHSVLDNHAQCINNARKHRGNHSIVMHDLKCAAYWRRQLRLVMLSNVYYYETGR